MIKKIMKKFATKNEYIALLGDNMIYKYFTKHHIKTGKDSMIDYLPNEIVHPAVFLLSTPTYENIGDHAISVAELQFLEKHWKGLVYEITLDQLLGDYDKLHTLINENDIICIQAGGNMGTEYLEAETIRRKVISDFPKNRIASFPQTIFYGKKTISKILLMRSKKAYNKHKSLYLFAREENSYNQMKRIYDKANVVFAPDIVLQAKFDSNAKIIRKESVLICLRGDIESLVKENQKNEISDWITQLGYEMNTTDMAAPEAVGRDKREITIINKLNEFAANKLVVTDRIHGMIFAALTGTPCIALSNYNHKVEEEWKIISRNYNGIIFLKNMEDKNVLFESIENILVNDLMKDITPYDIGEEEFKLLIKLFKIGEK